MVANQCLKMIASLTTFTQFEPDEYNRAIREKMKRNSYISIWKNLIIHNILIISRPHFLAHNVAEPGTEQLRQPQRIYFS